MATTSFKRCTSCNGKMPDNDAHEEYLSCLGEKHLSQQCDICDQFTPQTRKLREQRLKAALYDQALFSVEETNGKDVPESRPPIKPLLIKKAKASQKKGSGATTKHKSPPKVMEPAKSAPSEGLPGEGATPLAPEFSRKAAPQEKTAAAAWSKARESPPHGSARSDEEAASSSAPPLPSGPYDTERPPRQRARARAPSRDRRASRHGQKRRRRSPSTSGELSESLSSSPDSSPWKARGGGKKPPAGHKGYYNSPEKVDQQACIKIPASIFQNLPKAGGQWNITKEGHLIFKGAPALQADKGVHRKAKQKRKHIGTPLYLSEESDDSEEPNYSDDSCTSDDIGLPELPKRKKLNTDDDMKKFNNIVAHMIRALNLPAPKPPEAVDDLMFPAEQQDVVSNSSLPALYYLLKLAKSQSLPPLASGKMQKHVVV